MKTNFLKLTTLLVMAVSIFSCCHHHLDNPCAGAQKNTAEFDILEHSFYSYYPDMLRKADTNIGRDVVFAAKLKGARYEWKIGSQTYTTDTVRLNFNNVNDSTSIPITLTIHKAPDPCFPNDDTVLTVTKNMYINWTGQKYFGTWQGYYTDDPNTISNIVLRSVPPNLNRNPIIGKGQFNCQGLYPGVDTINDENYSVNYIYTTGFLFYDAWTPTHAYIKGYLLVDETGNNITINYYYAYFSQGGKEIYRTFIGKRL